MKRTITHLIFLTGTLFLCACHTTRRGEPITGPMEISDPKMARGRVVFFKNCHQCHPGGDAGLGPALNNKPAPVFLMKTQVRVGLGAMPGFSQDEIFPEDLDALMSYVIKLRKADRS
jgi:mono/diheme cytochrome c family protein